MRLLTRGPLMECAASIVIGPKASKRLTAE